MTAPSLGPLTDAIRELPAEGQGPPAIIREWGSQLQYPGHLVFLWAAATRIEGGCQSWWTMQVHIGDEEPTGNIATRTPGTSVERMLSPLAHEGRIRIMQAMYERAVSPTELTDATGFRGGGLYHHLRELRYASYVKEERGRYELTPLGRQLLLTVTCLAAQVVKDEGEEGLAVGSGWDGGQ